MTNHVADRQQNQGASIEIQNLSLNIPDHALIAGLCLSARDGERIGISGPSGCGKTTLLRSIVGRRLPTGSSAIRFLVESSRVGYVPQTGGLLPWFMVKENVRIFSRANWAERSPDCDAILHAVEIDSVRDSLPGELSGGELQRARLACAVASQPALFCADEPLSEVGIEQKWKIFPWWSKEITRLNSLLILVSHDLDTLLYLCDRILLLRHDPGTPATVAFEHRVRLPHPRRTEDLSSEPVSKIRGEITMQLTESS